ncbi:uncharacterized protein LOC122507552 [Leptopilina heterotoma]|uniref:uncharacterized protein LOC122507552 n=1 Tax=Leptopilina heterotoma TaxID=63436 RepID=UPI001CA835F6|nr:uncharacterized protein LOC122507552 [Leptopilina heterotoma]
MATEKTEAFLVTSKRSFEVPKIGIGWTEVSWGNSLKHQEVTLDRKLKFDQHAKITSLYAVDCMGNLSRMMPNVGGPRVKKWQLVVTVVQARQLYAAPAWTKSLKNCGISDELLSAQGGCARRVVSAYKADSTSAALVLASFLPVDLLARERQEEVFQLNKDRVTSQEQQSRNLA